MRLVNSNLISVAVRESIFSERDDLILKSAHPVDFGKPMRAVTFQSTALYDNEEGMRRVRGDLAVDTRLRFLRQFERGKEMRMEALEMSS